MWVKTRKNPYPIVFTALRESGVTAFFTRSSADNIPVNLALCERLDLEKDTYALSIPLGATINMDGTAIMQGVATVFLAQVFGVDLGAMALLFVVVTAVAASIGSPATPGTGIVILSMVLEGVGIPVAGIALILGVDRILDMSRTAANVAGDLTACVVLGRWVPIAASPSDARGVAAEPAA